ncbi:hypothetical protein G7Y89_g13346 [Cudoniella acicularis]|uniref:DUF1996 domain-containing protein n=1 Tax=Cudoniella acicularis TaxID=354080 RepID=A0A8H4VYC7_9HELO|nr:hypothetical protein G7Y89_g13346 [Cudoniella acicularis]
MLWTTSLLAAAVALLPGAGVNAAGTTLRFSCAQLVVERLDPIVNPGVVASPHLHQVVGGNSFNASMDHDVPSASSCTSCTPVDDFSNYWTATLFFKAKNGTYKRVATKGNPLGYSASNGGQTVYYLSSGKVTAFKPGFRMTVGDPSFRTAKEIAKYKMLTFTCLQTSSTRDGATTNFPKGQCKVGIMVSVRFPTCWDGVNLDSPDHQSHTAYPSGSACPSTHPVSIPQVFYETIWDTTPFNDKSLWPDDGSQPFVWSFGDKTGYGNHADYVFGWKGDTLQKAMDSGCSSDLFSNDIKCPAVKVQTIEQTNKCKKDVMVNDKLDGWLTELLVVSW